MFPALGGSMKSGSKNGEADPPMLFMKKIPLLLVGLLLNSSPVKSAELSWDYHHGWTKGFVLNIDSEQGTVSLQNRETGKKQTRKIINGDNVSRYLASLLKKIPASGAGVSAVDGVVHKVTFFEAGHPLERTIHRIDPPSSLYLNEDVAASQAEKEAETFRKSVDAFLLVDMLRKIKESYFPDPS